MMLAWCVWAFCRRRDIARHRHRQQQMRAGQVAYLDLLLRMEPSPRLRDYALARRAELG